MFNNQLKKLLYVCFTVSICVNLWLISLVFASVPAKIDFQGRLTDDTGTPITGTRDFTFSLYSGDTGGSALWTETQTNVSIQNGIWTVNLGDVNPFTPALFDGTTKYLEVQVGASDILSPRIPFVSVPYSFKSSFADLSYGVISDTVTSANIKDGTIIRSDLANDAVSNTVVTNLNADLLDGKHSSAFLPLTGGTLSGMLVSTATQGFNFVYNNKEWFYGYYDTTYGYGRLRLGLGNTQASSDTFYIYTGNGTSAAQQYYRMDVLYNTDGLRFVRSPSIGSEAVSVKFDWSGNIQMEGSINNQSGSVTINNSYSDVGTALSAGTYLVTAREKVSPLAYGHDSGFILIGDDGAANPWFASISKRGYIAISLNGATMRITSTFAGALTVEWSILKLR
jgi:hypothetical protein